MSWRKLLFKTIVGILKSVIMILSLLFLWLMTILAEVIETSPDFSGIFIAAGIGCVILTYTCIFKKKSQLG